ncbi:MAG TPA: hypothetical protein VLS89_09410 [Candidatus Nanopelagicales bacterium]|nr:hypothetical protein [Candidatus Nanopelagicales bacterium]
MSILDELFQTREHMDLSHAARTWLQRISRGDAATVKVVRKRNGLSYGPARLHVIFNGKDEQRDDWDTHVSEVLASAKIKAVDRENEALRLALMLADWFQHPAQRFGDDYFNSVLVEYLKHGPPGAIPEVRDMLRHVHEIAPHRESSAYLDCRNEVVAILQRGAQTLMGMGYPRKVAEQIFVEAMVQFLDDRFGVTNRRMLGLL